jgi:putative ABC transport system permease protein
MQLAKLILRNALRHKLRTGLTVFGIVVAILAFGLLRTVVDAWYAGAESASAARLVTRNSISLVFPLPLAYKNKIRQLEGVKSVSYANWFGGIYINEKNFFPQFAIDAQSYLDLYPEYLLSEVERKAFITDRSGCVVGSKLAQTYGFKIGDVIPLRGTIYAGTWNFTVRGIYEGAETKTDRSQFFFHWDYLNETIKKRTGRSSDNVGVYIVGLDDADEAAEVAARVDSTFRNSLAETLTETEQAFQLSFVAMTEAIVVAIRLVSFVVIIIILAVMANTMAMTARERTSEYATLKALGFGPLFITALLFGESLAIALTGGVLGMAATFPVADGFGDAMGTLFPVFEVSLQTLYLQALAAAVVGAASAILPTVRVVRAPIAESLRNIG